MYNSRVPESRFCEEVTMVFQIVLKGDHLRSLSKGETVKFDEKALAGIVLRGYVLGGKKFVAVERNGERLDNIPYSFSIKEMSAAVGAVLSQ